MSDNAPTRAAKAAGGQSKLARLLNIKPQAVQHWCSTGKIPAERVLSVETATGISRHELRPDLYPHADSQSAA
ncbi:transcriptional regulator [Pseudomonas sp. NMI1173_11]|uniref:transcriptional regulator n=1 Tax=Pseudomonas sp. NMI1173_11 TaxID=2903145 RepID=UPI001E4CD6EF|nr:Cro/CI family transcriptional regulator [Pseudomonas sp. NMI1173_11]MCE1001853.1 helix-turn-helix domain-containing protein [Pseudomonas sp. NMI1173_11]